MDAEKNKGGALLPPLGEMFFKPLEEWLLKEKEKRFRLDQLAEWYFKRPEAGSFQDFSNFPKSLREKLETNFAFSCLEPETALASRDGTQKNTLLLRDGLRTETVTMPMDGHRTVCLSTQVGCPVSCRFCFSGRDGLKRNLTLGELADSLRLALPKTGRESLNLVIMGMGEPFYNYANLKAFLALCKDKKGFDIGSRRITVSTVGVIPGIENFAADFPQMNLAVSLHAPNEKLRRLIIPRAPSKISELMPALKDYFSKTKRLVTFEYVMIKDLNDGLKEAGELARLVNGLDCKINLIPLNDVPGGEFSGSPEKKILQFEGRLKEAGLNVTVRRSKGGEISGACGQLAARRNAPGPKKP
ncbi:23S rRNA (adenine(2503)-C(2))-methyltransferase RlmN [bacterium]|nr:23S rRNA (adenine(2503)-C(2))-methyltransferase RlmN [bacterium]